MILSMVRTVLYARSSSRASWTSATVDGPRVQSTPMMSSSRSVKRISSTLPPAPKSLGVDYGVVPGLSTNGLGDVRRHGREGSRVVSKNHAEGSTPYTRNRPRDGARSASDHGLTGVLSRGSPAALHALKPPTRL